LLQIPPKMARARVFFSVFKWERCCLEETWYPSEQSGEKMAKYLVTGGAGFIGSSVVRELLKQSQSVCVLDNFSTGKKQNLSEVKSDIEIKNVDIRDSNSLQAAFHAFSPDFVIHEAALPSVPRSMRNPYESHEVNATGTLNVLLAARSCDVKRLVYAASSSAYGDTPTLPKHEGMLPNPLSPYAVQKLSGEHYCRAFARSMGLETICLRYFNVFGPRQDPASEYSAAIPKFINMIRQGKRPTVFGDGTQSRDFTFVSNVVSGTILAAQAPGVSGKVINIACGNQYTVNELVESLNHLLGTDLAPDYLPKRSGDIEHSHADITLARKLLGYEPSVTFAVGLEATTKWFSE